MIAPLGRSPRRLLEVRTGTFAAFERNTSVRWLIEQVQHVQRGLARAAGRRAARPAAGSSPNTVSHGVRPSLPRP